MARRRDLSNRVWEPWEDRLLRTVARQNMEDGHRFGHNGDGGSRYVELAARLGRTRCAVTMRASRLGVRSQHGHGRTVVGISRLPVVPPAGGRGRCESSLRESRTITMKARPSAGNNTS